MYAPKAFAGWHLHNVAANVPLDAFCLFSSIGSGIGNIGQASYAAGNACLDAHALSRRAHGMAACSLQWPLVATAGMGAAAFAGMSERQVAFTGMAGIPLEEYAACLGDQLAVFCGAALSVQMAHRSDVHQLLQDLVDASEPRFGELVAATTPAPGLVSGPVAATVVGSTLAHSLAQLAPAQRRDHVEAAVLRILRELTGTPADTLTAETPLMEAGVDSLSATELSSRLRALTGVPLSPTIVFEQPTLRAVADHLLEQAVGGVTVGGLPAHMGTAHAGASLVVASVLGQWPGGCNGKVAREQLQCASGDALSDVPASRWALAVVVDVSALTDTQVSCVRHGGFVSGAQCFDALFFGTSPAEAGAMDPQQRLLLEHGYAALHHASQRRTMLMGGDVAVFLGIERPDWALAQPPEARGSVYAVTGDNVSVAAGRVSFVLGLQGPCSSVDTACASALVALHGGAHAARSGECVNALSLAVSLKLVPHGTLGAASAGMLSADGRCKTLDARANGYARSEGVGALVLRRGGDEGLLFDGSAVRQDGRSASLTAPNGSAQRVLLLTTLGSAVIAPSEVACVEAHGTGTALGDPTEAGALSAVHGTRSVPLTACAAKASVGHTEAASGQVGLLRVWRLLVEATAAGNAQLRALNPLVRERLGRASSPFMLPAQEVAVGGPGGGISAFGFSGTIAHAVQVNSIQTTSTKTMTQQSDVLSEITTHTFTGHYGVADLAYVRCSFPWLDPVHPFVQRRLPSADEGANFRSPVSGALASIVADHVVQSQVIFPGAGYLELGRAAWDALSSLPRGGSTLALRGVFFRLPLVVETGCKAVECAINTDQFEVRSGEVHNALLADAVMHCSGSMGRDMQIGWREVDHPAARAGNGFHAVDVPFLYTDFTHLGLQYGPDYRPLLHAWASGRGSATSLLRIRQVHMGVHIHPGDLDGAMQLCAAAAPLSSRTSETRLPFAVDEAQLRVCALSALWAVFTQRSEVTTVSLTDLCGDSCAQLEGIRLRLLAKGKLTAKWLYETEWVITNPRTACPAVSKSLLVGQGLFSTFPRNGKLFECDGWCWSEPGVVLAAIVQGGQGLLPVAEAALSLLSSLVRAAPMSTTWLVSVGVQLSSCLTDTMELAGAGLWGLARSSRAEMVDIPVGCIDLSGARALGLPGMWRCVLGRTDSGAPADLEHSCVTAHDHVPRLAVASPPSPSSLRLHLHARGSIASLVIEPLPAFIDSGDLTAGEARLCVHAVSLNFRDVLNVLGEYPGDPGPPGGDCAGTVAATSDDVTHLCPSDLAFGFAHAPLASMARAHALLLSHMERSLSFEEMCTLPVVWSTVHVALGRSMLCAEQELLVHAAMGGIGIAAVEAVRWLHATVDASASLPHKHAQLRYGLGISRSCSSRNAAALGFGASRLQHGRRLHSALNSLSLDFISGSLWLLAEGGAFCEIGKRSVWSAQRQHAAARSTSACHTIALDMDVANDPLWMQRALALLWRKTASGVVHALPLRTFDLALEFEAAFRVLLGGVSTGKVVLCVCRAAEAPVCLSSDAQLLTGGTGGLGLLTARWLAQQGAHSVVLVSRTGALSVSGDGSRAAESVLMRASATRVLIESCDAADASEARRLLSTVWFALSAAVGGVWHAAGVLADGTIAHQGAGSLRRVYGPKAHGVVTLQHACAMSTLRSCALFSSVAALLGGAGQANYAAANSCLDSHAAWRRNGGTLGVSVQWGPWAEIGMAAGGAVHARLKTSGFDLIGLAEGLAALQAATLQQGPPVLAVVPARWSVVLGSNGKVPSFLSAFAPLCSHCASAGGAETALVPGVDLESVLSIVRHTAGGAVNADAPLMEAGVDSLGAIELRNKLQVAAGGAQSLPSLLVFDHPTVRQLATLLGESSPPPVSDTSQCQLVSGGALEVAVDGLRALVPAGTAGSGGIWFLSACALDVIGEVPLLRWCMVELAAGAPSALRHGGFVQGADLVDNNRFAVSRAEAAAMDPQQRLLLECGYEALHAARLDRVSLGGSLTGVFVGIAANDFAKLSTASPVSASVYAATGSAHSIASGRLSYALGLHGACAAYDSACSAALVAFHAALRALQGEECRRVLASGVMLMLTPAVGASFALAGMTSPLGRSHTFDTRSDGYARAEACAAASLVPVAAEGRTLSLGMLFVGVRGCAVRSDGRSASLTAPNGQAQQGLLHAALASASTSALSFVAAEAHGTGTALGDPIEAGSLEGAVLSDRPASYAPVGIGGVKANIGHAEPAAGLTGLVRLTVGLARGGTPPNAQLRVVNPYVRSAMLGGSSVMPTQLAVGILALVVDVGGVSSFGYSGTIVHALLALVRGAGAVDGGVCSPCVYQRRTFPWRRLASSALLAGDESPTCILHDMHLQLTNGRPEARWLYEAEWVVDGHVPPKLTGEARSGVLVVTDAHYVKVPAWYTTMTHNAAATGMPQGGGWHAVVLASMTLAHEETGRGSELHTVSLTLAFMQVHAALSTPAPVWICTRCMPGRVMSGSCTHAGLWGLARSCRQEVTTMPVWCIDMSGDAKQIAGFLGRVVGSEALLLPGGVVRGLLLSSSLEPEATLQGAKLHVPRLVVPLDTQLSSSLETGFKCIRHDLDSHTSSATAKLDMSRLTLAYELLGGLCNQYARDGIRELRSESVPLWHHKLLLGWGAKLAPSPLEGVSSPGNALAAHPDLWAELGLAERCGPRFEDALTCTVAYQELLFPGGSMELTRPVYEEAVAATFYNLCVVAAVEVFLANVRAGRRVATVEVGAGTGGTALSVLPVVEGSCERYVFTDVSDFFLRAARTRFAEYAFIEYALLNIDADPRFQGFGSHQYDMIVATNVLHATPFMRNTLHHCEQLLRPAGLLIVNELLAVFAFVQITFGLTDGWWLFSECRDAERVGQDSPLLSWRQWESLLFDSGFEASHCMQGDGFLRDQAVVVAQVASRVGAERPASLASGAHFFSGGLGGLGLLAARVLIEGGARQLVLSSRSDRVVAGSEGDWAWLSSSGTTIRRTRCDVSDEASVIGAVRELLGSGLHLGSVFHTAHQLADAMLANQSALNFRFAYGPKVHGAQALHIACWCAPLSFFNMFSSTAGLLGSAGQAPHSAASSWLDAMVRCRRRLGVRGQSVNWGAVAGVGYTAQVGADRPPPASCSAAVTFAALCSTLLPASRSFIVLSPDDIAHFLANSDVHRHLACSASATGSRCVPLSARGTHVSEEQILQRVVEVAGTSSIDVDTPVMEAGVDSLGTTEFRLSLQHMTGGVELPRTLLLDYPTVRAVSKFLSVRHGSGRPRVVKPELPVMTTACYIRGLTARLPRDVVGLSDCWDLSSCAAETVTLVPSYRWELPQIPSIDELFLKRLSYGNFVYHASHFDSQAFQISLVEAIAMDPQVILVCELTACARV
jgi:acyl transferase domain-containing protein/NADPH:quinone reductase-like Zn-dependent oxidoreductase/acyl carrier protein